MCCYKLAVLVLGLTGLLYYCGYCAQAEDVTFDPDNIGVCYQVRSQVAYRFYWGTVQRQNANTYSCRTIWNWPTTCTKYWTTYAKVLIPVASTVYYRYVFCCPGYKDVDTTDDGSTPGSSAMCVPECDPECRNGGQCISPDTCRCPEGWTGPTCSQSTRVCSVNNGGCSQGCVDGNNGVATCVCNEGYQLAADKKTCIDVDECDMNNGGCADICINQNGTHRCECESGYILGSDFKSCLDIDECGMNNGECERTCVNLIGSFECRCPQGFLLDGNGRTCSDHDECLTGGHNCSQRCINFKSGFLCACYDGYELTEDNSTCIDIDECTAGLSGCSQVCTNTEGSFDCSCMVGFSLNADEKTCEDNNECMDGTNGGCDQVCVNSLGSFSCDCWEGFSLASDDTNCTANPCAKLGRPAHGNITCTGMQVTDESCTFDCDLGYYLQGSGVRICLPDGTWSGSEALCVPLECDELIPPDNAVIILPCQQTFRASCVIQCNDGYFIPDGSPSTQVCELTANRTVEWSPPPICLPIIACDPNPCLHGGRCVVISPVLSLCDCDGTGYTGAMCQYGVIGVPPFPLLRVGGGQPFILNYTAKPDDELQISLIQDNPNAVTFSPNPAVIVNPNISASIGITPLIPGLYRVAYILSGANALDFDIPEDSYLAITSQIAPPDYTYFIDRDVMIGRLLPSCCSPAAPIYTMCPNGGSVSVLSSCSISNISGALLTEGIMFSTGNGLNLPLAIAGARLRTLGDDILVDQLASNERSDMLDCSLCGSLAGNQGNLTDVPSSQCDAFGPAVSDIKDFLSSEALAFTYLIESRSLIPSWLNLLAIDYPTRGFGLNAYQVDLQREVIVNTIETCSNIPGITMGLHSLLHYSGLLDVTITNLFSNTFTPPVSDTPICFAVNLCEGSSSAFHIGLPQSARQFLKNNLNLFGANFDIAGVSMTTNEPLQIFPPNLPAFTQQYWNGRNRFTPSFVDLDIALTGTLTVPYQMNDLSINLSFSGILAFGVDNFNELISMGLQQRWYGVFSGGYTLDMTVPIYGSTANVTLIPTSPFGVVSFGGAQAVSACNSDAAPAGISFKVRSIPQRGEKDFLTKLLYVASDTPCDLDAFLYLTTDLRLNGFSLNFQCAGIRLGSFVFHELKHTVYFSGTGDFENLCAINPTFATAPSSVLMQSSFVNDEPIQLGPILLLQPTDRSPALAAVFNRDNDSFTARLYSVNITLFDTVVNTVVNINQDQLYFTANNVPLFTVFPVDYVGSVEQGKTFGEFPLRLSGTFVRNGASFPAILQQTVHDYLTTVANSSITRLRNAESAIDRAREQVRNIEMLLQVREEDFQIATALREQAAIIIAIANDTVNAALARVEAASEEVQQLKDSIDAVCQLQKCTEECIPGLQCKTCYTDVYSTVLGRCPNICYDQRQVRVPPYSETSTCWVRKQVRVRVRRCVCYRYHCTYRVFFTFVLRTVPEECHRPVFNYEIREEPRLCEKPCPVRVLTGRIAQQCCETNNCSDQVPSSTCLKENAACRVARQQALDTLMSAKQNFSQLLSELEEARMRLAIAVSEEIRIRIRVEVTREAVNRTQAVLDSARGALELTIAQRQELLNMIQDGVMLYRLLQNTSVENTFLIDSVSFDITIVDKTPFTIPLNIQFTIPGISESFEATVVFDFSNIGLHLQRTAEVLARMAFGNVDTEDRTKRSRRQTVVMEEDPDSTTALVNQRCTDLLNIHDYIEELQDTLETIVEQILSSKLNATEAKLQNDAIATVNEEAFATVNFSVLQTEFGLPAQPSSLLDNLGEGNESRAITAMISSFGEMDEDLASANENSVFLDWQATLEMLHNQTGSSGGYSCFGFADCLTTVVTITRELLELSPIPESRQLLSQLPEAADNLLQLALSTNLSIFNALRKTEQFQSILNATREMNYWCAQPPNITQHPASNISLGENSTLRLTCQASSEFRVEYQWRRNGLFIPGAVDAVLVVDNVQQRHSGNYSCDARNHAGISQSINSSVVVRTIPSIFLQPSNAASYAGNENGVVFACNASGTPTPGYRWYFTPTGADNMSIIDGAENNEYTVFSPQANNGGLYFCEAYNEQGSTFSRGAVLTVLNVSVSQVAIRVNLDINKINDNVLDNINILNALQDSVEFGEVEIQQLTSQEDGQNQFISFLLVTKNTTSNDTNTRSLEELATRTVETRSDLQSVQQQLQMLVNNGTQITSGAVLSSVELGQVEFVCPEGQALDTTNNLLCVNCPPGNFQTVGERVTLVDGVNVTESLPVCSACGANQVQPEQGQTSCISCSERSANSEECLVECSPGTFSSTGYQPCSPCPAGSYQPNSRGTACLECGSGSPEAFCSVTSEESSLIMGLTPIAIAVGAFIVFTVVIIIICIYCVKRRRKRKQYRVQKKGARPSGPSKLSLIGVNRINSDKRVTQKSDVYVCMPHNENPNGASPLNDASSTDNSKPMFERFILPDTPPPPPPRSNPPSRSGSLNTKPEPPPIPPRPEETEEAYVIPNRFTSSPVDPETPPLPPKPVTPNSPRVTPNGPNSPRVTPNGPNNPRVRPQKPPMPLPRAKPSMPAQPRPQAKPAVMPRIVRRLSQRYRQHNKLPPEAYESFLTDTVS